MRYYTSFMHTIQAILEVDRDGTVHLPVPPELRRGKLKVTAFIEPGGVGDGGTTEPGLKGFGCLKGKIWIAPEFDEPVGDVKEYME